MIDLRSDTLTKPTEAMRAAMASAEVGDDVYGEDPTVARLEERVAGLFGHEAALFMPTGSMGNVLAVRSLVAPGQEVLCEASAHIVRAELGAHGAYSGITTRTWVHPRGQVDLATIRRMFAPDMGPFFVPTVAISIENTHNFAGGAVLPLADLRDLREYATGVGARIHLDGARVWNAHVATGTPLSRVRRDRGRGRRSACRRGSAPRSARCWSAAATRSPRRGCGASGWAAGCARSASSPRPACTPSTTTSSGSPTTTRTPGCWPRPVASTRRPWTPTSWSWSARTLPASSRPLATRACRSRPSGRPTVRMVTHLDVSRDDAEKAAAVLARL